ncbi:MAG: quercetin dioxygenase-like cupin family protein [Planctomycetota bacterium]|jgi:quercetin dioxygenase-like cupin family protein
MDNIEFYLNAIKGIEFEDKQTSDVEIFGIYRVPTSSGCIEFVKLYKGIQYKAHIHDFSNARFIFLTGTGKVTLNEKQIDYQPGFTCEAPSGMMHGFIQNEETIFLSIQSNPIQDRETGEIDIRY